MKMGYGVSEYLPFFLLVSKTHVDMAGQPRII